MGRYASTAKPRRADVTGRSGMPERELRGTITTAVDQTRWRAGHVLSLQRSIGNHAVSKLVTAGSTAARIIQRDWECPECDATGRGKPKSKCPNCGYKNLQEVKEKPKFGDWWDSLTAAERQDLLRAQGTHEAHGGAQQKKKGGGPKKGGQHDTGVAKGKSFIKEKYDAGDYDD